MPYLFSLQLATLLAGRGYTFIASYYYRPLPPIFANGSMVRPGCPEGKILATSAALIKTWLDYVQEKGAKEDAVLQELPKRGLVLVGHSLRGTVIMDVLGGTCLQPPARPGLGTCEGYQPSLVTTTSATTINPRSSSSNSSASNANGTCKAVALPMMPKQSSGNSRSRSSGQEAGGSTAIKPLAIVSQPLIRGAVVWEGYKSQMLPGGQLLAQGISVPSDMFLLYLSGSFNNNTAKAFQLTNSSSSSCSCSGYAKFPGLNHFGINNWQSEGSNQVTSCAMKGMSDPPGFSVSRSRQEQGLRDQAEVIDLLIRSAGLRHGSAGQQLRKFEQQGKRADTTAGFALSLKGACSSS